MRRLLPLILLLVLALSGCGRQQVSLSGFALNTAVSVTVYGGTQEDAQGAMELCRSYETVFSRTDPDSELYRLNHREIDTVSDELARVIAQGLAYSRLTDGAFDITAGSISQLWDFTAASPAAPPADEIREGLTHVGYEKVTLEGNRVVFSDPGTVIDLGAIAKGYIADRMADYLRDAGVASAIIDLGGNLFCLGGRLDGSDFQVGVQYPYEARSVTIGGLGVRDKSVVTSGVYERCFTQDGRLYHHILDTATGFPVENGLVAVTVVSDCSLDGDALSTGCFALGLEEGMALVESLEGMEAAFITEDLEIHLSSGLEGVFYAT